MNPVTMAIPAAPLTAAIASATQHEPRRCSPGALRMRSPMPPFRHAALAPLIPASRRREMRVRAMLPDVGAAEPMAQLVATLAAEPASPTVEQVFLYENYAIFPFWVLMIAAPDWAFTKALFRSYALWILLGGVYAYQAYISLGNPAIAEGFSSTMELSGLAGAFGYEDTVAVGWAHFIAMDMFAGRWVYLDGQKNNVFNKHSLLLTLFFGPLGIVSHVVTRFATSIARGEKIVDVLVAGLDGPEDKKAIEEA